MWILKFIWRGRSPRIANTVLKEKNQAGRLKLLDSNTYYKEAGIKTV